MFEDELRKSFKKLLKDLESAGFLKSVNLLKVGLKEDVDTLKFYLKIVEDKLDKQILSTLNGKLHEIKSNSYNGWADPILAILYSLKINIWVCLEQL